MQVATRPRNETARALATALGALALVVAGVAAAHDGGGHGGGGGGGGGGHGGGAAHAGGGHAGAAPRGAYAPRGGSARFARGGQGATGYRPRATYVPQAPGAHYARGGAGGAGAWRGGGWRGGGGGWWHGRWWGGYGLGLFFATLPWYYETYWWGGVPYYYADYNFYRWNDAVDQYEVVAPPTEDAEGSAPAAAAGGGEPFVYPRLGQPDEQQRRDRYDCYRWAADQTGFDPTHASGGPNAQGGPDQAGAYRRAESACLEGRGYTVR